MGINPVVKIDQLFDEGHDTIPIVYGEDKYLYDGNGKKYIDFCGGIWNVPFGYTNQNINEKIIEQMNKLPFCNLITNTADIQYKYASRLCRKLNMTALLYTCSGSECIEAAIKICRKYQALKGNKRKGIGALCLSYHGTTYGAMSVSGVDQVHAEDYYPLVKEIKWIKLPIELESEELWLETLDRYFSDNGEDIAGIIIEPVLGSGGVVSIPVSVLKRIEQLCREWDVLLVDDEVTTGFGRTGVPFVFQKYDMKPDLVCLSKGITNGYLPLGVVVFSDMVTKVFAEKKATLDHFSTQGGNLLSIAAADAVLDLMDNYESYGVEEKGEYFQKCLRDLLTAYSSVRVYGSGLMIAISFNKKVATKSLYDLWCRLRKRGILAYCFNNPGYNIGLSFYPPFTCNREELKDTAEKIVSQIIRFPEVHGLSTFSLEG